MNENLIILTIQKKGEKRKRKRTTYFKKVFRTISEPHVNLNRAMISSNILSHVLE